MTAEIINLNKVRKARLRTERERVASENRVRFGTSKVEREAIEAERSRADARLDGSKREEAETASATVVSMGRRGDEPSDAADRGGDPEAAP